jgi:hypothetical protein
MSNPLNNVPGWQSFADDAALLAHLLADDSRRIAADPLKMETAWAGGQRVVRDFGTEVYEQMMGVLKSVAPATGDLLATGIDFGDPKTQAMLDNLADGAPSVFTAERIAVMRAWGNVTKPRWQWFGIAAEPTIEDVAGWRQWDATSQWWGAKSAQVDDGLFAGTITTQQQIVDLLGGG